MIKYNSNNINKWYLGNGNPIAKMYHGSTVAYDVTGGGEPTPPTPSFDGKVRLTYSNGEVYEVPADGNTTLTQAEVTGGTMDKLYIVDAQIGTAVTSIDYRAFSDCSGLTSVVIPDSVTNLRDHAFTNCTNLTSIDIPNSVTSIGYMAFANCTNLTSVTIGSGITRIGYYAFNQCSRLTGVTIEAITPPTLEVKIFYDAFSGTNCIIYVPAESVDTYKSASRWSSYASRIQAIPT